jgi:hypothetical protein
MKTLDPAAVDGLVANALEQMAFVMADPVDSPEGDFDRHSRIEFWNEHERSEVFVSASDGFLVELASSMLGEDEDDVEASEDGVLALKELANVLAGEVITALGGAKIPFNLGIPELVNGPEDPGGEEEVLERLFDAEGEGLRVSVRRRAV